MRAVEAARSLGFTSTAKYTLQYDELQSLVADGQYPIVYLSLEAIGRNGRGSRRRGRRGG